MVENDGKMTEKQWEWEVIFFINLISSKKKKKKKKKKKTNLK
jgi:hypothetical protein